MDISIHFLHLVAAILWAGGQLFLALVLDPLLRKSLPPRERMPLSLAVARRFKRISHGALGVLVATGLWQVRYVFLTPPGSFVDTDYGQLLLLKMAFLALALLLGVLHDRRWGPALARWSDSPDSPEFKAATRRLVFWARINVLVTLAIVACAAALRHTSF